MKKTIVAISLLAVGFLFVGCTKDKVSEENGLSGSKWQTTFSNMMLSITFTDSKNVLYLESSSAGSKSYKGTYTFAAPNIRINIADQNQNFEYNGEVSGSSMKLTIGYNGSVYTYQKVN